MMCVWVCLMVMVVVCVMCEFDLIVYGVNGFMGVFVVDYFVCKYLYLLIVIVGCDVVKICVCVDVMCDVCGVMFLIVVVCDVVSCEVMVWCVWMVLMFAGSYDADAARAFAASCADAGMDYCDIMGEL